MTDVQISCFLTAAAEGGFSAAADKLYLSPPTLGRHIAALEQELGFPLFQRGWKNTTLTAAGEIMYEGLSKLSGAYTLLVDRARAAAAGLSGRLSLGMLEGQLIDSALRDVLQRFEADYPGVHVDLRRFSFREMTEELRRGSLDAGITLTLEAAEEEEMEALPLYLVDNEMVLPDSSPLAGRDHLTLADFAGETFVEVGQAESPVIAGLMRESCRRAGFVPRVLRVENLAAQIAAVELGRGVAAFNSFHETCNHPGLVHIPVPELPRVEFSLVWSRQTANPLLPCLIQTFRNAFPSCRTPGVGKGSGGSDF